MTCRDLLVDAARRPVDAAASLLRDISPETLHARPGDRGNSIAWLVWHAARQQDAQVAALVDADQVWVRGGWAERLGVPRGPDAIGFGDTDADVAALHIADPDALLAYLTEVVGFVADQIGRLSDASLAEVIDTRWDPPVTRGVRIISTIDDAVAHLGQAAYARGLVEGWRVGY